MNKQKVGPVRKTHFIFFMILLVGLGACASKNQIRPGDSLEVAFEKANGLFERERYTDAARAFETVLSIGRGTEIAQESQYLLAESYFKNRNYLVAASEYRRYYTNYPRSERRIDAEFTEASSYYRLSPRYKLDQTDTYRAIELMQLFIGKYPTTDQAAIAAEHIDEMRSKLAQKEFGAAELYMRIREYRSAVVYYELTLDKFPETTWAEKALVRQIEANFLYAERSVPERQVERYQLAIDSYQRYVQLFPRGDNRSLAEEFLDKARIGMRNAQTGIASGDGE